MDEKTLVADTQPAEATGTCQQQAYDFVKSRILNRDFKPGQYITDNQVAEELSISRTPVREALRILEHEGFLISQARQGWKVYTLSLEDIHGIFDIKLAVESMVAGKAAECKDEEKRANLKNALGKMRQAVSATDYEAWRQADTELHYAIFAMYPNERALRIVENLNEQWYRLRIGFVTLKGRMERSFHEHVPLVESILAGNGEEAERHMRAHINNVQEELVQLLVNVVLPFVQEGV